MSFTLSEIRVMGEFRAEERFDFSYKKITEKLLYLYTRVEQKDN